MKTEIQSLIRKKGDRKDSQAMKAAVIVSPGRIALQQADVPEPADDEVSIRIEGCGVCASSLPLWQGREWFTYPAEAGSPGHEGWGIVEKTGKNVHSVQRGDRVCALSWHAFAEYDLAAEAHVVKLPDMLDKFPFPGEPLGCAMNIFNRSGIEAGKTVAVIGIGFIGSLLVQLAKDAGARVFALSWRSSSLEIAERFGADRVWLLRKDQDIIRQIEKLTHGNLCECVVEATGKQRGLNLATELTAVKGRLVIAGYHQDGLRQIDMQVWNWRGMDVINAHERDPLIYIEGMNQAVRAIESGTLNPFPLYTHLFPKEEIQQAFETHLKRPEGFTKALVTFS